MVVDDREGDLVWGWVGQGVVTELVVLSELIGELVAVNDGPGGFGLSHD